jgi:hypothetical protein
MAMREFTDSAGIGWRVWDTVPRRGAAYHEPLKAGWLTFENAGGTRKRLGPIPHGWETASPERLELMCRVAEEVQRTGTTRDPDVPQPPTHTNGEPPSTKH